VRASPPICYVVLLVMVATTSARLGFEVSPASLAYPGLNSPTSITYDPAGLWVVSDTGNDRVVLLNMDLSLNSTLSGGLSRPRGIAVDAEGRVWISDSGNNRVVVSDPDLSSTISFGSNGSAPGEFNLPWGIAVSDDGRIAVSDALNRRIQIFGPGIYLQEVLGSWGSVPGSFDGPLDLEFDSDGRLFVVDTYLEAEGYVRRVQIFNSDLTFNRTIWDIESRLRFRRPVGIGVSPTGIVAVADCMANRVYLFSNNGTHIGGFSIVPGQVGLSSPYDVAFAPLSDGDLLMGIVERRANRIRVVRLSIGEGFLVTPLLLSALLVAARGPLTSRPNL